jgi:ribulose-5-phosphate 4-epimerase/fuculose-1-phosphate aldolase
MTQAIQTERAGDVKMRAEFRQARLDLAAVLRWSARLGYQQGVCNHFSFLLPNQEDLFLVNPEGFFWSELTASSLIVCDLDGNIVEGSGTVERTAFCLHAPIHRHNKRARAALHTHTPYATALCLLEGGHLEPVNMAGFQFAGKIAYDENHQGGAHSTNEGDREVSILGDKNILMMRNHGPMVVGRTIASAFDRLYYLEEVCKRQVLAMSTNRPMQYVPPEVVQQLSEDEELFDAYAEKHLTAIKRVLSREEPEFAQ